MRLQTLLIALVAGLGLCQFSFGQAVPGLGGLGQAPPQAQGLDKPITQRWKVGVEIQSVGGPSNGLFGTVPVPKEWPEQQVKIVNEEISPYVRRVTYRNLDGVSQMLFTIPMLPAGEKATALVTFEVTRAPIAPPETTDGFVIPANPPKEVRPYLAASPFIEARNSTIRDQAKKLTEGKDSAWLAVEAMYDWVRDNVNFQNGKTQGAVATLKDKKGNRDDLTSLFIALCRVEKIPARTVFVPDNCYAEFYLHNEKGEGHWFPCQVAGTREFGGMADRRPILQKGDNFKVPEKNDPQRFVAEFLTGQGGRGAGTPDVRFIRNLLPAE